MSDRFVIDASIALAWVHPSQATSDSDDLLHRVEQGADLLVPSLWFVETANALLVLQRRKKITEHERLEALSRLTNLCIASDDEGLRLALSKTSALAYEYGLSVYDACYLELALRRDLPIASRDENLCAAAKRSGVKLL